MSVPDTINLTCCLATAVDIDLSIKKIFNVSSIGSWSFWKDALNFTFSEWDKSPSASKLKYVAWEPSNKINGSVLMTNRRDGGDTVIYNISRLFKFELIKVYISTVGDAFPYYNFQYFKGGKEIRRIYLMLDGNKWVFFTSGDALPFEDIAAYKKRRTRDRFDGKLIVSYLKILGWEIDEGKFWKSSCPALYGEQLKY